MEVIIFQPYQFPTAGGDPPGMKLLRRLASGVEVGFVVVRASPSISWTRSPWSTPNCAMAGLPAGSTLSRLP